MITWHRIVFNIPQGEKLLNIIKELDIKYSNTSGMVVFEISDRHPHYLEVANFVKKVSASDFYDTECLDKDIVSSEWLLALPRNEIAYPQPQSDFHTKQGTYKFICSECKIFTQVAPFMISKELDLHGLDFFSLIWTAQLFTSDSIIRILNQNGITGYEPREVLINKTGEPSKVLKQLFIHSVARPGIFNIFEKDIKTCKECGTAKIQHQSSGTIKFKKDTFNKKLDLQHTHEWFGSGWVTYHGIVVSNKFARLVIQQKLKGLKFKIIETV